MLRSPTVKNLTMTASGSAFFEGEQADQGIRNILDGGLVVAKNDELPSLYKVCV